MYDNYFKLDKLAVLLLVEHPIDTVVSWLDNFFSFAFGVLSLTLSLFAQFQQNTHV